MKLMEANINALDRVRAVLSGLNCHLYVQPAPHTNGLRIGAHMRHVLEFYGCFLDGIGRGCIDYDARSRDASIERNLMKAMHVLDEVTRRLRSLCCDGTVRVHVEGIHIESTVERELLALREHTIHHCALIAVAVHAFGMKTDPDFGIAPSTLRYRAMKTEAA